jgi:hypothetical protein
LKTAFQLDVASSLHLFLLFVVRVSSATPLAGAVALKNEEEAVI